MYFSNLVAAVDSRLEVETALRQRSSCTLIVARHSEAVTRVPAEVGRLVGDGAVDAPKSASYSRWLREGEARRTRAASRRKGPPWRRWVWS